MFLRINPSRATSWPCSSMPRGLMNGRCSGAIRDCRCAYSTRTYPHLARGVRIVSHASMFAHLHLDAASFGKGGARLCLTVACIRIILIRSLAKCLCDCPLTSFGCLKQKQDLECPNSPNVVRERTQEFEHRFASQTAPGESSLCW
jgi:hypothetical protein